MKVPLILTVDVSKGYGDFVLMDIHKQVLEARFRLDDNAEGHKTLKRQMQVWKKQYQANRIVFVAESTGGYEDNWLRLAQDKLISHFVEAYRINPKIIYHEYQTQRRSSIDDGISARTIAEHVVKNLENFSPKVFVDDPEFKAVRSLIRHLVSLQNDCTGHKNSLLKILYQYLPSLEAIKPAGWPNYFIEILIRYGSLKSIQSAARQGFKQLSRLPKGKALQIADALANGIDMRQTPESIVFTIRSKARQIKLLEQEIKEVENQLISMAPVDPSQVKLLRSIQGMGPLTPVILLCFIEDFERFDDAKQMAAFFGVQPRLKSSGDSNYKSRMSKQGSGLVRRELYLLAFRCLETEPYLRSIYASCRSKGMVHGAALGCLMHKIVRIIYGMLKNNQAFDAGTDQLNQKQNAQPKEKPGHPELVLTRRFQEPSLIAPISRLQKKKRKENGYEPQAAGVAESARSS